jgi:hypothetical protein
VFELTVDGLEERMLEEQTKEESEPFDVSHRISHAPELRRHPAACMFSVSVL